MFIVLLVKNLVPLQWNKKLFLIILSNKHILCLNLIFLLEKKKVLFYST